MEKNLYLGLIQMKQLLFVENCQLVYCLPMELEKQMVAIWNIGKNKMKNVYNFYLN